MLMSSVLDAEQASRSTEERTDGAGLLVAEIPKGANHSLHSRAPRLISLMFSEDLLDPARFSSLHVSTVLCGYLIVVIALYYHRSHSPMFIHFHPFQMLLKIRFACFGAYCHGLMCNAVLLAPLCSPSGLQMTTSTDHNSRRRQTQWSPCCACTLSSLYFLYQPNLTWNPKGACLMLQMMLSMAAHRALCRILCHGRKAIAFQPFTLPEAAHAGVNTWRQ